MGCLSGLAALLALAVPASIAPTSLVGAYIVLGLLTAAALGLVALPGRRRRAQLDLPTTRSRAIVLVVAVAAGYGVVVALVHALAS